MPGVFPGVLALARARERCRSYVRRSGLPVVALLIASFTPASAQTLSPAALSTIDPPPDRRAPSACVDAIPDSALSAAILYLHPSEPAELDSATFVQLDGIEVLTQLLADKLKAIVHAAPGTIPSGEPFITWRNFDDPVLVTAYRDGKFLTRRANDSGGAVVERHSVLSAALDSLHADGERFLWTAPGIGDSVSFAIELLPIHVDSNGKVTPPTVRIGLPIATIMAPREQPPRLRWSRPLRRPEFERREGYRGKIMMEFMVDSAGRAEPKSIRNLSSPRLYDDMLHIYEAYVAAVSRHIETTIFDPARISSCAVRRLVRQRFDF